MKSVGMFACIILLHYFFAEGAANTIDGKPLHLHMSKSEMKRFFGANDYSQDIHDTEHSSRTAASDYKYLTFGLMTDNVVDKKLGANANHTLMLLGHILSALFRDSSIGKKKIILQLTKIGSINYRELPGVNEHSGKVTKMAAVTKYLLEQGANIDAYSFISSDVSGGLAVGGSICRGRMGATIVGYIGLNTVQIIAHELGHALGVGHDTGNACPSKTFIMSSLTPSGSKAWTWSKCAREKIQAFLLDDARSSCLDDNSGVPLKIPREWFTKLPGQIIDPGLQCQYFRHDSSYSYCPMMRSSCGVLGCRQDGKLGCIKFPFPKLEGADCGERHWCIGGECIDNGNPYIDGGWSEWSDFVPCTMECGVGVTYRERTCTNPPPKDAGHPCKGSPKGQYKTCNTQPCPAGEKTYRQKACEQWDRKATVTYSEKAPCHLLCKTANARSASRLGIVKDGARCNLEGLQWGVCVNGECKKVGCDHELESGKEVDICGVCEGGKTDCHVETGTYTETPAGKDRGKGALIAVLPIGTTSATFKELKPTLNHIGIQDSKDTYLIPKNQKKKITIQAAGTEITLVTRPTRAFDELIIHGKSTEVLKAMYIQMSVKNPGVRYEMVVPGHRKRTVRESVINYEWKIDGEWSECSVECAGGTQTRAVHCVTSDDNSHVGQKWCSGSKPPSERECNVQPCKAEWHLTRWKGCSKTCGKGVQTRTLLCRHKVKDLGLQEVSADLCDPATKLDVTEFERSCREIPCYPVWQAQPWSECSTSCNAGESTREVLCIETDATGQDSVVPDIRCIDVKPVSQKRCNLDKGCAPSETKCPAVSLCQNGATCVDDPAGYKCSCNVGYKGYFCETQEDPCENSPCFNGGTCDQDDSDFLKYTCQCPIGYTGEKCEVRINPCDSGPCLNDGVCVSDDDVVLEYNCDCTAGYSGKTCEVPPSYPVACLLFDERIYSVKLGTVDVDFKDTKPAIDSCRKLAHTKGYQNFALGSPSQCVATPNKKVKHLRVSSVSCYQGIGKKKAVFAYTFEHPREFEDLGCYKDKKTGAALDTVLAILKSQSRDDENLPTIVEQCAYMARAWGYDYFAIKMKTCVSSPQAATKYDENGKITEQLQNKCKDGVGLTKTSMEVFHFKQ